MGFEKSGKNQEISGESKEKTIVPENLGSLKDEKLKEGRDIEQRFESAGKSGIEQISGSIRLPEDKIKDIKDETSVESKIGALNETAEEAYAKLDQDLKEMFNDGISSIEEIHAKMDELEKAHKNVMAEKRKKQEEEIGRLENMSDGDRLKMKEDMEKKIFGGKTLEEAKKDTEALLSSLKEKEEDFIKNPTGDSGNGDDPLKEKMREEETKDEDRIAQMEKYSSKVQQEAIQGVQQAVGEKKKVKICPNCGRESEISANFCGSCGNKFESLADNGKDEKIESSAGKIKEVQNFPDLFQALKDRGPVKNSFDVENGPSDVRMVDPEMAIDIIKSFFNEDLKKVAEEIRNGKRLGFLKEDGVNEKVAEIFEKAARS